MDNNNQFNRPWIFDRETLQDFFIDPDDFRNCLESKKAIQLPPTAIRAIIILKTGQRDPVSSP